MILWKKVFSLNKNMQYDWFSHPIDFIKGMDYFATAGLRLKVIDLKQYEIQLFIWMKSEFWC